MSDELDAVVEDFKVIFSFTCNDRGKQRNTSEGAPSEFRTWAILLNTRHFATVSVRSVDAIDRYTFCY
jgi:hypothetical protein